MEDDDEEYVYAIGHPHGYVKIGRSVDPEKRLITHQSSCPYELWLICQIPVQDSVGIETTLHDVLFDKCVRGEWYDLDHSDYDTLVDLMRMTAANGPVDNYSEVVEYRDMVNEAILYG